MMISCNVAKPFVKWVGGKGQLLNQLEKQLPAKLYENEFTYIEPFVGGGAMLFFILQKFPNIKKVVINDINSNLINAYKTIKNNAENLVYRLRDIEQQYFNICSEDLRKKFYLEMRRRFNEEILTSIDNAAIFIFLNRTCFNGLYRENSKGKFNVPFGRYTNPRICNEDVIYADSELLNKFDVEIMFGDFKNTAKEINNSELNFLYFDPPYRPISVTSCFNSYAKEGFNDNNQKELASFCRNISSCDNVMWMLSNSDCSTKNPTDTFFEDIYEGFCIQRINATRMLSANASRRGKLTELLISNFEPKIKSIKDCVQEMDEQCIFNKAI